MIRRTPRSTRTYPLLPCTTLFRSARIGRYAICTWLTLSGPLRPCHRNAPLTSAPSDTDTPKDSCPLKDKCLVRVLLPLPLAEPFSYRPGPAAPLAPGDIVEEIGRAHV